MRLQDKVILITGSYTGIGRAIARQAVKEGARVVLNGLRNDLGKDLVKEFEDGSVEILIWIAGSMPTSSTDEARVTLSGRMFQKAGRWWWSVQLPGEARCR